MNVREHPTTLGDGGEGGRLHVADGLFEGGPVRAVVRLDEDAPEGEPCLIVVVSRPEGDDRIPGGEVLRLVLDADCAYALAAMLDSALAAPAGWRRVSR